MANQQANPQELWKNVRSMFRRVWKQIKAEYGNGDDMLSDTVQFWWPTIKETDLDWDLLANAHFASTVVPFHAFIMAWVYGYARALDDQQFERIRVRNRDNTGNNVPAWLVNIVNDIGELNDISEDAEEEEGD